MKKTGIERALQYMGLTAGQNITDIAWERIGDEIMRMLTETDGPKTKRAFELLDVSGLLAQVLPEIAAMKGVEQSPDYHPRNNFV